MATEALRILVVGAGGREHAIAWKLAQSRRVEHVYVAPGNGGTLNKLDKVSNVEIQSGDFTRLTQFAKQNNVHLVVPGPEQPIVDGIELAFRKLGIPCFGPTPEAAKMEASKTFAKKFMMKHGIPTAEYKSFADYEKAKSYVESLSHNVVVKASGLAAGKGVLIPTNKKEALDALEQIMVSKVFGPAGDEVVIEEFLEGQELSVLTFSDGYTSISLPPVQDYKCAFDGDKGPNTGGMGCYCPTPIATPELIAEIDYTIVKPTIAGMRHDGIPFVGMLFTGIMVTSNGLKVLEYNVRFGDPETETVLPLLSDDTDLAEIMLACIERRLDSVNVMIRSAHAVTVILASGGYPGQYSKGKAISFCGIPAGALVFHAGTCIQNGEFVTSGGRVLAVSGVGSNIAEAKEIAYKGVKCIHFDGVQYRTDIAQRALEHVPEKGNRNIRMTYASAGVSIETGNRFVHEIKALVKKTARPGSHANIGEFGGLFDLKAAGYIDPILIASTDGVGTKLKIAQAIGDHKTIGIDLVAMSVNDLIVQGAEPLFFLDYYACGNLDINIARDIVNGVVEGCQEAGCALVGGETAEMPIIYRPGNYDLAGFAVGAVERGHVLPQKSCICAGDILVGLASSGVHSNGYSLIHKIIANESLSYNSPCPWDDSTTIGKSLLVPTQIYVKQILPTIKKGMVKAMAHITGGGFVDNVPRVLPDNVTAVIDIHTWPMPPVFKWIAKTGNVAADELFHTFNCGIGMVLVVSASNLGKAVKLLQDHEYKAYTIGWIVNKMDANAKNVMLKNLDDVFD